MKFFIAHILLCIDLVESREHCFKKRWHSTVIVLHILIDNNNPAMEQNILTTKSYIVRLAHLRACISLMTDLQPRFRSKDTIDVKDLGINVKKLENAQICLPFKFAIPSVNMHSSVVVTGLAVSFPFFPRKYVIKNDFQPHLVYCTTTIYTL